MRVPTVRGVVLIVTVRAAVMLMVLKSAIAPTAFGTVLGVQRVATDQLSLASAFQTSASALRMVAVTARIVAMLRTRTWDWVFMITSESLQWPGRTERRPDNVRGIQFQGGEE